MGRLKLFASPFGRINRREFWLAFAAIAIARLLLGLVPVVGGLLVLPLIWFQVCINGKRLHDFGRSAWWTLLPVAVGILAVVFGYGDLLETAALVENQEMFEAALPQLAPGLLAMGVAAIVNLLFVLWIGLTPGQPAANRFG